MKFKSIENYALYSSKKFFSSFLHLIPECCFDQSAFCSLEAGLKQSCYHASLFPLVNTLPNSDCEFSLLFFRPATTLFTSLYAWKTSIACICNLVVNALSDHRTSNNKKKVIKNDKDSS